METADDARWWHIVWTTYLSWPPHDRRGDWKALAKFYENLRTTSRDIEMSRTLPVYRHADSLIRSGIMLTTDARNRLNQDIRELTTTQGDRVAGNLLVTGLAIEPTAVHLVLSCSEASLSQRVGRLKSRSATLLSFRPELGVGGSQTWGRGFWWARLPSEDVAALVSSFLKNKIDNRAVEEDTHSE